MVFTVVSVLVPVLLYFFVPIELKKFTGRKPRHSHLLLIAALLFFIAWYLPSPDIQGRFTAFSTHLVGGGVFTGFLWLYLQRNLKVRLSPLLEVVSLFFLVSGLGVINELFELTIVQLGIVDIPADDTWWDLLANTLGALLFWLLYRASKVARSTPS